MNIRKSSSYSLCTQHLNIIISYNAGLVVEGKMFPLLIKRLINVIFHHYDRFTDRS